MKRLTPRQQAILDFIKASVHQRGYPPSVREIGEGVGLRSSSTVHAHLSKLEEKGFIRRDPTKPRAIEILVQDSSSSPLPCQSAEVISIPVLGRVAAGMPFWRNKTSMTISTSPPILPNPGPRSFV